MQADPDQESSSSDNCRSQCHVRRLHQMLNAVTQLRRPGGPPSAAVRGAVAILSLVLLAGALSAHAQAQQLRPFTFILDFLPNGEYGRSEEHTSELQSRENLVCRLLLEKKKQKK